MRVFDVIEYPSEMKYEVIHHFPETGVGDFRIGSQIIVRQSQAAVFASDGKALDVFRAGRHTITTTNIPLLIRFLGKKFDDKIPFTADVYFISLAPFSYCKWGIHPPIIVGNSTLDFERVHGYGTYSYTVDNPALFVERMVKEGFFRESELEDRIKSSIRRAYIHAIWTLYDKYQSVIKLTRSANEVDSIVVEEMRGEFRDWGLSINGFFTMDLSVPKEDIEMKLSQQKQEPAQFRDVYNISGENIGVVGAGSHVQNVSFSQIWNDNCGDIGLDNLAHELSLLRSRLTIEAIGPEHGVAIGEVSQAEISAKEGNGGKVLSHLSKAGQWTLDIATKIGVPLAVEAIKMSLGMGK